MWRVEPDGWPSFDITAEDFERVDWSEFDRYWPAAQRSLAETVVPEAGDRL